MVVMTESEKEIVEALGEIWNMFLELPVEHPMANVEFCSGVHVLQQHVAARPAFRGLKMEAEGVFCASKGD